MQKPDYNKLRDEAPFIWSVAAGVNSLLEITGIPAKEMFLNSSAGIELFKKGRPALKEMYGHDVSIVSPTTPPISYGHINALGAELNFPDQGEVNHSTLCNTLEEGIEILKRDVDFSKAGMSPFYLKYKADMQKAFPDEKVRFGFKAEGPMTTAYILRRDKFFYDFYDNPILVKEFLKLTTESIIQYKYFTNKIHGQAKINPLGYSLADDCAAMLGPDLWEEFVIPYIEQYFQGLTTGKRAMHVEDLRPAHLHFLEQIGLSSYDPYVSAKINPKIIREKNRVPFKWALMPFAYPNITIQEAADFVYQAVADGASFVSSNVGSGMCNSESAKKVHAFIAACKDVEQKLKQGVQRQELAKFVSASGKEKFWDNWPK